jgi:hypothetical protein
VQLLSGDLWLLPRDEHSRVLRPAARHGAEPTGVFSSFEFHRRRRPSHLSKYSPVLHGYQASQWHAQITRVLTRYRQSTTFISFDESRLLKKARPIFPPIMNPWPKRITLMPREYRSSCPGRMLRERRLSQSAIRVSFNSCSSAAGTTTHGPARDQFPRLSIHHKEGFGGQASACVASK